jgi:hypothetical protein
MVELNSNEKKKDIWSLFTVEQLAVAIASLGDRTNQLKYETWRLNSKTELSTSLWAQVIEKLKLDHNEKIRHSLYNIWHRKRRNIKRLVKKKLKSISRNKSDGDDDDIDEAEKFSVAEKNTPNLPPDPSLPLHVRPKTRASPPENLDDNSTQSSTSSDISFTLTASEWKAAFSRTRQKMNDGWTNIFYQKLKSCGITCAVSFKRSYVKKGKRKHVCERFWCRTKCTRSKCTRSYLIIFKNQTDVNTSALFLVRISGKENHNAKKETMARQLCGEERYRVGM